MISAVAFFYFVYKSPIIFIANLPTNRLMLSLIISNNIILIKHMSFGLLLPNNEEKNRLPELYILCSLWPFSWYFVEWKILFWRFFFVKDISIEMMSVNLIDFNPQVHVRFVMQQSQFLLCDHQFLSLSIVLMLGSGTVYRVYRLLGPTRWVNNILFIILC